MESLDEGYRYPSEATVGKEKCERFPSEKIESPYLRECKNVKW